MSSESAIENAKNLSEEGKCAQDAAVGALDYCSCDASMSLRHLKSTLPSRAVQRHHQGTRCRRILDQLEKGITTLIKERDQGESRRALQRRKILPGQLAYTMGKVVHGHVMQNTVAPVTLPEMLAGRIDLDDLQQQ